MNSFTIDESNYTVLDINGIKMNNVYKLQDTIYKTYDIIDYIFIVDNQDEITDHLE